MKFIFLDFDGVMHPVTASEEDRFCHAQLLAETIGGLECEVRLVISSSLRGYYSLNELRTLLPKSLRDLIVGITPHFTGRHQRFKEIKAFLKDHPLGTDWRALDDDASGFPKGCPQLILCNCNIGLDDWNAGRLRRWIKDRL
jgi:hypothetical protein